MKFAPRKYPVMILLLALLVGGCGEEKAPPPLQEPLGHLSPSTLPAPAEPVPVPAAKVLEAAVNTPPRIDSVHLSPAVVLPGTLLKAEVAADDPDGDLVMLDFEWKRNDRVISEAIFDELDTTGFDKGDLVTVAITPFDGKQKGEAKRSLPIVILNRPPEITSFPPGAADDGTYVYEVVAADPDGDKLTFSLETKPQGMSIDKDSGRLEWDIPADLTGSFAVRVIVSDGDARTFQGFSLNLTR